ncbi:hypothetical protein Y032_0213g2293 [Ancylostoma ceylanicum]|uniref:Uncharacterized protein n=1 Tax=Ancylostoma ceylanicum TaxID=53326 RepID=A0A016SKH0_9BILA|nr:hypothetical protein Y032_0213g2293 [Ancylostoma ceylanicum]
MYKAGLSLCSVMQLPTALCGLQMPDRGGAVRPTDARSRRCYAAHRCPLAAVLCGPQMPDRGSAVRPTDVRSRRCCAAYARPTPAPRCTWPGKAICNTEVAE